MASSKDIAWSYFALLTEDRLDEAFDVLDDDGYQWSARIRQKVPLRELKGHVRKLWDLVPMRFTLHNALEVGDHAVLELESNATRPDAKPYNNRYCFVVRVADGKIVQLHEYADFVAGKEMLDSLGGWPPP